MRLTASAVLAIVLAAAPGARADTAPGRVVFPVDGGVVSQNVDGGAASDAVALPDGGAVLVGGAAAQASSFFAARISANGALDPSFGRGGVAQVPVDPAPFAAEQVLRQPDGRLLVIGPGSTASVGTQPLYVVRLNPDGSLDAGYGVGGVATTGIGVGCSTCDIAALGPDGSLVVTGATGRGATGSAPASFDWVVTRLLSNGAVDRGFATNGRARIETDSAVGYNVAVLPDGAIVAEGQKTFPGAGMMLTRLTPSGAPDSSFAGGSPISVPLASSFAMLAHEDGAVDVAGEQPRPSPPTGRPAPEPSLFARYTSAGQLDHTTQLGEGIEVTQLLDGVAIAQPAGGVQGGTLLAERIGGETTRVGLPFGGGGSSFVVSIRPRPLPTLAQNTFRGTRLVPRPDGSFLVVGGVKVSQPTGEGAGFSIYRFAAAALTPSYTLDSAFGGAAATPQTRVRVVAQRAATAHHRHGVRVELTVSSPGLCRVGIRAHGRTIAQSVLPLFATGRKTLPVELTRYGNAYLRHHRRVRVTVEATTRDLLTATRGARATGTLR